MKLLTIIAVMAAAVAGAASAQTTTNCRPTGFGSDRSFQCTSREMIQPPAPRETGFQASQNAYNSLAAQSAAQRSVRTRRQVGQLLASGRCDDARNTALQAGEIELAGQVNAACR